LVILEIIDMNKVVSLEITVRIKTPSENISAGTLFPTVIIRGT
jgi:hypothetical protein